MIRTVILALVLLIPAPVATSLVPAPLTVTEATNDQVMAWTEGMLARHWVPSPPVWGHAPCVQRLGETTLYRCADGFQETS